MISVCGKPHSASKLERFIACTCWLSDCLEGVFSPALFIEDLILDELALKPVYALNMQEMAGLYPDRAALRTSLGSERAAGREPQPGLHLEAFAGLMEIAIQRQHLAPPGRLILIAAQGAQRSRRTSSRLSLNNGMNSTPGRPAVGRQGLAPVSISTCVRSERSNCQSLTNRMHPGTEPGV